MTVPAFGASRTTARKLPLRAVLVTLAAAVFLSLSGAFGMDALPLLVRLAYWLTLLAIGQLASVLIRGSLDRMTYNPTKLVIAGVLECIVLAAPLTLVVWGGNHLVLGQPFRLGRLFALYPSVLLVTGAMIVLNLTAQRRPIETHAADPAQSSTARIFDRLPPKLRGAELHAVEAEDHYVRLHTSRGSDLVRLRFADALVELEGLEGAQVHRSWWVARTSVERSVKANGQVALLLSDGARVPVSRGYMDALRAAGWFGPTQL